MKNKIVIFSLAVLLLNVSHQSEAALNVFACEPEWAALSELIGGDQVTVISATTAYQDPHFIQARPSLIAKMRKTDLLICSGADLEVSWLPLLLRKSGNRNIQAGTPGYVMATEFVRLRDKPTRIDRSQGDLHVAGNPHIHTDPRNLIRVARALAERLIQVEPSQAQFFQDNLSAFEQRWKQARGQWRIKAAPLRGMPIAVLRNSWPYLVEWLKLKQSITIEQKPGVPPTSKHLASLLERVEQLPVKTIIYASNQSPKAAIWLSEKTAIPVLELPFTVGGNDAANTLFNLYENTIDLLLEANKQAADQ